MLWGVGDKLMMMGDGMGQCVCICIGNNWMLMLMFDDYDDMFLGGMV